MELGREEPLTTSHSSCEGRETKQGYAIAEEGVEKMAERIPFEVLEEIFAEEEEEDVLNTAVKNFVEYEEAKELFQIARSKYIKAKKEYLGALQKLEKREEMKTCHTCRHVHFASWPDRHSGFVTIRMEPRA